MGFEKRYITILNAPLSKWVVNAFILFLFIIFAQCSKPDQVIIYQPCQYIDSNGKKVLVCNEGSNYKYVYKNKTYTNCKTYSYFVNHNKELKEFSGLRCLIDNRWQIIN